MRVLSVLLYKSSGGSYSSHTVSRNQSHIKTLEYLATEGHECFAIFSSVDLVAREYRKVLGVDRYTMEKSATFKDYIELINSLKPSVILLNDPINPYSFNVLDGIKDQKYKIIARCHTELHKNSWFNPRYLGGVNEIVVCLDSDIPLVEHHKLPVHVIPFFSDESFFSVETGRDIDFVSSTRRDPVTKQYDLVTNVFSELTRRGYNCVNIHERPFQELIKTFMRGKVFYYPSLLEGCSRVLFEAVYAKMEIVVDTKSKSCCEISKKYGFSNIIDTGVISYNWGGITRSELNVGAICDQLEAILKSKTYPVERDISRMRYFEEIKLLASILVS